MKRVSIFLAALAAVSLPALAAAGELVTSVTLKRGDAVVWEQTNRFANLSAGEEKRLFAEGLKSLDYASRHQDKGGNYALVWKWGSEPAVETAGMKLPQVRASLKNATRWLTTAADTVQPK
jgi:hypothetical protein